MVVSYCWWGIYPSSRRRVFTRFTFGKFLSIVMQSISKLGTTTNLLWMLVYFHFWYWFRRQQPRLYIWVGVTYLRAFLSVRFQRTWCDATAHKKPLVVKVTASQQLAWSIQNFPKSNQEKRWRMRVSIPLPTACEAVALPYELIPRVMTLCIVQLYIHTYKSYTLKVLARKWVHSYSILASVDPYTSIW